MKTLLICVDFSDVTDALIEQAGKLASLFDQEIVVLHVGEPDPSFVGFEAGPDAVRSQMATVYREQSRELDELAHRLSQLPASPKVTPLLIQGPTAEKILEHAARLDADMILMGTHGHGRLYHLLVGGVSESVLKSARRPVLLVRSEA